MDITIDIHSYPEQRHPTGHHGHAEGVAEETG